jgi:hypothetical protein
MTTNWESKTGRKSEGGVAIKHNAAAEGFVGKNRNTEKEEMNKTKTRCLSLALVIGALALFGSGVAVAQTHGTGMTVTKTCPDPTMPVAQGAAYQCSFAVTNSGDIDHGVANLAVTNTYPWISAGNPGNGPTVAVPCMQGGVPVTALGIAGSGTQTCTGTVDETAPDDCNPEPRQVNDRIAVTGSDAGGTFGPVSGSATNGPVVLGQDCSEIEGRMTGGGSVFAAANRITHGFELHCDELDLPNNLEVNWGRGNNFHLEELLTATCTDDPTIDQRPPGHSPFDTFIGTGIGRCNGESGALISFTFVRRARPVGLRQPEEG